TMPMHRVHERCDRLRRRVLRNSMAQVEYVPAPLAISSARRTKVSEDASRFVLDDARRRDRGNRAQFAWRGAAMFNTPTRPPEAGRPVQSDGVAADRRDLLEPSAAALG